MAIELAAGKARAVILPGSGGRLHQLRVPVGGQPEPILLAASDPSHYVSHPTRGGSFPMAPWPNRVAGGRFSWSGSEYALPLDGKPHANHGRVLAADWEVLSATGATCEAVATFDEGWPWRGSAWQRFVLSPTALRMELEVRAHDLPFPAGAGWHPWFRRDVAGSAYVRLSVPAERRWVLANQIPTGQQAAPADQLDLRANPILGERRLDDCYTALSGPVVISWHRLQLTLTIECGTPHVMVYTPPEAVCVEPQTCAPDAFNLAARDVAGNGMAVAVPGHPVRIASTWSWQSS